MGKLITQRDKATALAFPDKVDRFIATNPLPENTIEAIAQCKAFREYTQAIDDSRESIRPISFGLLKLKAHLGRSMPKGKPGRGNVQDAWWKGEISDRAASNYRRLAENVEMLQEYYDASEAIPSQEEFFQFLRTGGCHVKHNSQDNNEWYTPSEYLEAARNVMGSIDLDPCSCEIAQRQVKAETYFTADDDGLAYEWCGNIWMNPPYGKGYIVPFCEHFLDELEDKRIKQAVVLVNNATDTAWCQALLSASSAVCFPSGRIRFLDESGEPANSPVQGQVLMYFGNRQAKFGQFFGKFGCCLQNS